MTNGSQRLSARRRIEHFLKRLGELPLQSAETAVAERFGGHVEVHRSGSELLAEGVAAPTPRLLLSGWACRQRLLPDGRRQIFGFVIPGDLIGVAVESSPLARVGVFALTRTESVDASALRAAALDPAAHPSLARFMAAIASMDEQRLLDHVVRLGRYTAYERVAHLLLELSDRLAVAGLGDERRFPLPITQECLADALGLSVVHVNRILQQLRRERLIEISAGQVMLLDRSALNQVADYVPPPRTDGLNGARTRAWRWRAF